MLKKLSIFCFLVLIVTVFSQSIAQSAEVIICTGYNDDQSPTGASTSFTMGNDGGRICVMVRCPDGCQSSSVGYFLYKNGQAYKTIYQDTQPGWTWFVNPIDIYEEGDWRVEVVSVDTRQDIGNAYFKMSYNGSVATQNNPPTTLSRRCLLID